MFTITVSSHFEQLWRYNIFASCGGFNAVGESVYVVGDEMISCEELQSGVIDLPAAPEGFDPQNMTLTLRAEEAHHLRLIVYIVAHTLPEDRIVLNSPPFDCLVTVKKDSEEIYCEIHKVNQWGGLTANINI